PEISGSPQVGSMLSTSTGTWTNNPISFRYQWNNDGSPIAIGATTQSYSPVSADIGHYLTVTIIASGSTGASVPATSLPTAVVTGLAPVNTALPVISGTAQVGQTLAATNGAWSNAPSSFAFQWYRGGGQIAGATAATYMPVSADIGTLLSVTVIASNA